MSYFKEEIKELEKYYIEFSYVKDGFAYFFVKKKKNLASSDKLLANIILNGLDAKLDDYTGNVILSEGGKKVAEFNKDFIAVSLSYEKAHELLLGIRSAISSFYKI